MLFYHIQISLVMSGLILYCSEEIAKYTGYLLVNLYIPSDCCRSCPGAEFTFSFPCNFQSPVVSSF